MNDPVKQLISNISRPTGLPDVFNPWNDVDPENEIDQNGPQIRSMQLNHYLKARVNSAKYLIIGEAVGYQGGHFSGVAMTSERILLGHMENKGIHPHDVVPDFKLQRTSKPEVKPNGFTEPTATIVWSTLLNLISPLKFVLWNTFAWHPYDRNKGLLSNRRPKNAELEKALPLLKEFIDIFPNTTLIAVGKVAEENIQRLGFECQSVRHPAQGGATEFRRQIKSIVQTDNMQH